MTRHIHLLLLYVILKLKPVKCFLKSKLLFGLTNNWYTLYLWLNSNIVMFYCCIICTILLKLMFNLDRQSKMLIKEVSSELTIYILHIVFPNCVSTQKAWYFSLNVNDIYSNIECFYIGCLNILQLAFSICDHHLNQKWYFFIWSFIFRLFYRYRFSVLFYCTGISCKYIYVTAF